MDLEQEEMQFLGIFGIYKEAYKIIFSWKKIFSQITVALILPLCFIFLAYIEVSDYLFQKIVIHEFELDGTRVDSAKYNKISDLLSSELIAFWLLKLAYLVFTLIFSLLSTSAVVYTIACIYTGREVTFKEGDECGPQGLEKAHGHLLVYLCCCLRLQHICTTNSNFMGTVYWTCQDCVVSVLEDLYGFRAMVKSRALIRGKLVVAIVIFLKLNISLFVIKIAFERLVVYGASLVLPPSNIDKSALSDHLEVYMGEYVPLKAKDVQLEQYDV
ncbi:hypothetical protein CK203_020012 [Vitis vinifera]|uniref:Uncharacterized protein n=1 Tax=Vitis vinifera TaxID=29760 RepID=A0A438J2W6_VITVI|nr:hypothetical protein CK203_020012 [Vitis vinifera]